MKNHNPFEWITGMEKEKEEKKAREERIWEEFLETGVPGRVAALCGRHNRLEGASGLCSYNQRWYWQIEASYGLRTLIIEYAGSGYIKIYFQEGAKWNAETDRFSFAASEIFDDDLAQWFQFLLGRFDDYREVRTLGKYAKRIKWYYEEDSGNCKHYGPVGKHVELRKRNG